MTQIQTETLKFLKQLSANNNKPWFDANRSKYEAAKANFLEFTTELIERIAAFDEGVKGLEAKKTIFRINRDIRFSKDKSPYKSNMGASINHGGKKIMNAGYYFHIEPGNKSFAAAGSYQPDAEKLAAIRQEIDYHFDEFQKILKAPAFKKHFKALDEIEKLKNAPKGYSEDNPAIDILKHKHLIVSRSFTDKEVLSDSFIKELATCFKSTGAFIQFLNRAIE
jgi:uncharacterized protein (TIGR02453 family)